MLFHEIFDFSVRTQAAQLAIDDGLNSYTFADAAHHVDRLANALSAAGLRAGERFAYLSKNRADIYFAFLAASKIGAVPAPLNYRLAPSEWAFILEDCGARLIIAEPEYAPALDSLRPSLPQLATWIVLDDAQRPGWTTYQAAIARAPVRARHTVTPDDVVYQMYTSGTTGSPKGVMITHANLAANIFQAMIMLDHRPAIGQTALVVTPLYHAAAIWISTFAFASGMSIILHREFDAVRVLDALDARRVSFTFLVPAMINACLLADPDIRSRDWSALDLIMYGASPIAEKTLRDALDVFGCRFCQAYGMTETTAILSLLTPADHTRALSECSDLLLSAGRALPGTDIYAVAPDGRSAPAGVMGEIAARGPQIMKGYWNRAEEQAEMMRNGLAHTGDAGVIDNEGYIYLRDRIKDMVVSGGENIYPREVENILFEHPAVADAAIIGIPDAKYGEALLACLVLREGGSLSAEEIVDFCRGRLAGYKIPRRIAVLDALPRNPSGKVLKTELRRPYWQGKGRFID